MSHTEPAGDDVQSFRGTKVLVLKGGAGDRAGHVRVVAPLPGSEGAEAAASHVRVVRGPAKTGLDAPFVPPARCCYALSVYGTSVGGVNVSLWSMTSDRAAHGRLERMVRDGLKAAGIEMEAKPLSAPIRAGMESEGPPLGPAQDQQAGRGADSVRSPA